MGPNQHRRGAFPGTLGTCWEDDCLEQHPRACWMDLMLDTQVQGLVTGIQRVVPPPTPGHSTGVLGNQCPACPVGTMHGFNLLKKAHLVSKIIREIPTNDLEAS